MDILWKGQSARVREMGTGAPVVLVHGYPLDGAMWSGVSRALMSKFRIVKPDLPGRGDTVAPSAGSIEDYADFLEAILQALEAPAGLAGFSMGGYAALALARRRPAEARRARPRGHARATRRRGRPGEAGRGHRGRRAPEASSRSPTPWSEAPRAGLAREP